MSTFGDRLRSLRLERELTQGELGGEDLSTSYISRLESGSRLPTARVLARLADRLQADPQWLLTGSSGDEAQRLRWRVQAADLALASGDAASARQQFSALQASFAVGSDERRHIDHQLARAHERCADLDAAIELLEALLEDAGRDPGRSAFISVAIDLARCYREAGDLHRAVEVAESAVERLSSLGLRSLAEFPRLVVTLAGASRERGDHAHAHSLLRRLLDELGPHATPRDRGSALWNAAIVAVERGHVADAMLLARRSLQIFEALDDERALGLVRTLLAWVILSDAQGQPSEALDLLATARAALLSQGLQIESAYAETELARASTALGRPEEAIEYATNALQRLAGSPDALESARARTAMAHAMLALGEGSLAVAELEQAASLLRASAASRQAASVWRDLAEAHVGVGDLPSAVACLSEALSAAGVPAGVNRLEQSLAQQ